MPSLDDVYRKFGDAAEAAQLLETELSNTLFEARCTGEGLFENPNPACAANILASVDRHTLGQLLKSLNNHTQSLNALDGLLAKARDERNRLFHSFYREHNFRRNSEEGRAVMLTDLDAIHSTLLDAYKAIMLLRGINLDSMIKIPLPTRHLPI
jgi:hypothetical protein